MADQLLARLMEQSLSAELLAANCTPIQRPHTTGWRLIPDMVCAHIVDGADTLEFDDQPTLTMRSGDALCVRGGLRHRFTLVSPVPAVSRWSHARFTIFGSIDLLRLAEPAKVISGAPAVAIGDVNAELTQLRDDMSMRGVVRRRAALFRLLDLLLSTCPDPERGLASLREAERIAPALAAMEELIEDANLSVRTLALRCRLSPSRFHALFRAALGVGPVRYLQQRRMARAEQLLLATTERIRDVAARSGYADEFHFSRLFKRLHGLSPLAYREQTTRHGA